MGGCCSSEAEADERRRLIDDDQQRRGGNNSSHQSGANKSSQSKKPASAGSAGKPRAKTDENGGGALGGGGASGNANDAVAAAAMAAANAAAAAAQRAQQEAEAEADKLKTIVAKAEKGFIDLQDIAAALQPASVEESRFFGHLASLPAIDRQTHQFLLPTPSKSVKDVGVAGTLAAPDPFDSLNIDLEAQLHRLLDGAHNVPVESKGELIAVF